jgi:thiamin-phosphate kinase
MDGLLDYISMYNMEYLGGDLNKTKELVINPTVFGVQESSKIIHRKGIKPGDILVANERFGLTGVGFEILLHKKGKLDDYPDFKKSIESVLNPSDVGYEALILAEENLATSSIDSSDGLAKSLRELMRSNPQIGFEVKFDENLIAREAQEYSNKYKVPLDSLIFGGGEEFIHLFTISPRNFERAKRIVNERGGKFYKIGHVISEERIYYKKDSEMVEMKKKGYEHFD